MNRITDDLVLFWRGGTSFSNFVPAKFACEGTIFENSEAGFMCAKALYFGDNEALNLMLKNQDPHNVKKLGRKVKNFDNDAWDNIRCDIMVGVLFFKFDQNPEMAKELLDTGDRIIAEANPYDCIWGIGLRPDDDLALDPSNWKGRNLLGEALMVVRDILSEKPGP